jgi:short-subunit dehydrogenase
MTEAVQKLESELGPCDVMIANAGIYHKTDVTDFDVARQNHMIATNTQGVINTVGAVIPGMIKRGQGHLVAVASIAGMIGLPAAAAYSASKAAVIAMFQSLRVDLYPHGVQATVAAPGFVDTPLITDEERATLKDLLTAEQAAERICKAVERNRALDWFPWPTWLFCRLFSLAPSGLYRRLVAGIPDMEEPGHPSSTKR